MPRPKKPGAPEPKRRSRTGCWQCKGRKVKCGEERPACLNCQKAGQACDYSIRLNWDGRRTKRASYDGSSDSPVSPTRGQRSFTIINQSFKPSGHRQAPAQALPERSIKEEPWSDDTPTLGWKDDTAGDNPTWGPKYQIAHSCAGAHTAPAGHGGNADLPPDSQALTTAFLSRNSIYVGSGAFPNNHEALGLSARFLQNPFSTEDRSDSATVFSLPHEGEGGSMELVGSVEMSSTARRTSNAMATHASFTEATAAPTMRFHQQHPSTMLSAPPTPATPSSYSDDEPRLPALIQTGHPTLPSPGDRRLSVKSLLSGPSDSMYSTRERTFPATEDHPFSPSLAYPGINLADETDFYGYDLGQIDEDIGKNDDHNAISPVPPAPLTPEEQTQGFLQGSGLKTAGVLPFDFRFGEKSQRHPTARGGYYREPVAIEIPRSLGALPSRLQENPMNLLYFHHFLNHTARVLMPYDDIELNPFRTVLPQMAVKDDHLLSLLLAYSASHRAKLLRQKEPEMRIAHWVQGIFLALRSAIDDNARIVSSTNLATAMMLASLEIISPKAFGVAVPWQKHLNFARDLMRKHFPALRQMHSSSHEDRVCSFLWSWFAYLDVLGSLSGGPRQSGTPVLLPMDQHDDLDEIDCIMGFTTRCLHLLSKTADLVRSSDAMRILPDHSVDPSWQPPPSTMREAESLDAALRESLSRQPLPCAHIPQEPSGRNTVEMTATNEAFHWAALVQLHRRALGKPASDPDVMGPVQRVMGCLAQIRSGAAEMGMLFPMFTAGCEVVDEESRKEVLGRFVNMERNGMTQIRSARELMENVWREGRPWETMLKNEFIG